VNDAKWQTTKRARVACGQCGKSGTCTVSPDGTAFKCWKDGGKVFQTSLKTGGNYARRDMGTATARQSYKRTGTTYATAAEALDAVGHRIEGSTRSMVWTYWTTADVEFAKVARFDLANGGKEFRPIHRITNGWKIGDPPGPWPLYRLRELPDFGTVWITEGEKAADAACVLGLPAVTSSHGSSSAGKTDWTPLAGRDVVLLPDNDAAGEKYAGAVAAILAAIDPPARVKILLLPGLPDGGDIVEFIAGRDSQESSDIAALITSLADATAFEDPDRFKSGPVMVCLADVEPTAVDWLWPGRIALGRMTLLVGRPGEGKSFLTCDITARVTTGATWPDGSDCPAGSVILICGEDDPGDTIRPRLDAHYADVRRVHLLSMVRRFGDDGRPRETMFTLADVEALESALKSQPECKLVVIDPIGSYLGGGTDAHRDNEVRGVLAPVAQLLAKYGAAGLIVAHRRKSAGFNADETALGSRAFTGIARAVWHLSRDSENKSRRLLLPGKNNLGPEGDGLAFTIEGNPAAIAWEADPVRMTADEALAVENAGGSVDESKPGPEPKARNAATVWLAGILASGEVEASKVKAESTAAGLAWRTVQRACDELGAIREKNGFSGAWQWRLPKDGTNDAKSSCQVPGEKANVASWHLRETKPETAVSGGPSPEDAKSVVCGTHHESNGRLIPEQYRGFPGDGVNGEH
jgi:putative DNA primase/helicase